MIIPNFKDFRHSVKGTTWKSHKYIKRIEGVYYYPDDYSGGRHLPSETSEKSDGMRTTAVKVSLSSPKTSPSTSTPTSKPSGTVPFKKVEKPIKPKVSSTPPKDVESVVQDIVNGKYDGNQTKQELLSDLYNAIQSRVNDILSEAVGSKAVSNSTNEIIKQATSKIHSKVIKKY